MEEKLKEKASAELPFEQTPHVPAAGEYNHTADSQTQTAMAMDRQSDGLLPSCKSHTPAYSESELPPPLSRGGVLLSRDKKNLDGAPPEFCLSIHRRGAANPFKNTPH